MTQIEEALVETNEWWKKEFEIEYREREVYKKILKFMPLPQIVALTGIRRVGKTTLLYKMIQDHMEKGFNPKNIVYFSFDNFRELEIKDVLDEYERLMGKGLTEEKYFLLLDEVQKVKDWEEQLKRIYDRYKKNIKIVISGSESLFIRKKSKETLGGRIFEFKITPLTFSEFLGFKEVEYEPIEIYGKELVKLLSEFTLCMGLPELVGITDEEIIKKYVLEGVVEKVIYRDIPNLFKIKDISILASLLNIIMEEPGQVIEISDLAKDMDISRQTLSNYLSYLEDSFLIKKLYNFSKNRRKVERKLKKFYPTLISPNLLFKDDTLSRSKVFEWLAVTQLGAEFFWRDPYKNEVDIVLADKGILPIEVKYGKIKTKGLEAFMKKFNVSKSYMLTPKKEEKQKVGKKTIEIVPLWKWLLDQRV